MMQGTVTADREALLPLTVFDAQGRPADLDALLDTGYDGRLILPPDIIRALGLPFQGTNEVILAHERRVSLDAYRVTVLWHGRPVNIDALSAEGGPLLGMGLLYGSRLHMDIIDGAAFTLQPLP